ncbi:hypothetical protein Anas_07098, partial [Armadillidium nasatum]
LSESKSAKLTQISKINATKRLHFVNEEMRMTFVRVKVKEKKPLRNCNFFSLNSSNQNLESNLIQRIDKEAFIPLKSLEDINLGNNYFPELPSKGFERVVSFKAHNNRYLKEFPDPSNFPSVHSLVLSYAYHCCPFLNTKDFNSLWANLAAGLSPSSASGTAAVPYSGTTTVAPHSETIECIPTP